MSSNRLKYDEGSVRKDLQESVDPGNYYLSTPFVSCPGKTSCFPSNPDLRLQKEGASLDKSRFLVDVGSDLKGLNINPGPYRGNSKDPEHKYVPVCQDNLCNSGEPCGQGGIGNCKSGINGNNLHHLSDCFNHPSEDTRISNPSCNLRGTGWNRWEWLCKNPQENIEIPFDYNISNRIVVKDNHRPCIPNPIENKQPNYPDLPCENTQISCSNYTIPDSVNWQSQNIIQQY